MITHKLLATEARKLLNDYNALKAEYSELKKENMRLQKQLEF